MSFSVGAFGPSLALGRQAANGPWMAALLYHTAQAFDFNMVGTPKGGKFSCHGRTPAGVFRGYRRSGAHTSRRSICVSGDRAGCPGVREYKIADQPRDGLQVDRAITRQDERAIHPSTLVLRHLAGVAD
jgi:hypothetical protein